MAGIVKTHHQPPGTRLLIHVMILVINITLLPWQNVLPPVFIVIGYHAAHYFYLVFAEMIVIKMLIS